MAGVTDVAFRHLCYEYGCDLGFCEMVSANALAFESIKTKSLMKKADNEKQIAVQIFGGDPILMADMAKKIVEENDVSVIDINMGCPVPKVTKNGYGSALMKDPKRAGEIIESVSKAVLVPVTVKFRKGYKEDNAVEFAKMAEQSGADAVTVHGRTAVQMYHGAADWEVIRKVRQAIKIPVIANGGITDYEQAIKIMDVTGCEDIMIARGALGNPFIFDQVKQAIAGQQVEVPSEKQRLETALHHIELACYYKEEKMAILQLRKHISWYLTGMKDCANIKNTINRCTKKDDITGVLKLYIKSL